MHGFIQILMSVLWEHTTVSITVPILLDRTTVAVILALVLTVMEETAQVLDNGSNLFELKPTTLQILMNVQLTMEAAHKIVLTLLDHFHVVVTLGTL